VQNFNAGSDDMR